MNELAPRVRAAAGKALMHVDTLLVIAVAVLGVVTRFHRLDAESLWLDEAITFERSTLPLRHLLEDTIERLHLPVYFTLMHYWLRLGDDEFMMRAPAAVFGCLGVLAAIALGWVLAGRRGGWTLGLLCVLSPGLLRYAQEARMYSMLVLATTIGLCGLAWLIEHREVAAQWPLEKRARWAWGAFVFGVVWAMYSHNTAVFFWAACWLAAGVAWLALPGRRWPFLRNWLLANGVALLAWSPWLLGPLSRQTKRIREHFWAKYPSPEAIKATLGDLYLLDDKHLLPGAAIALAAVLGLWALRRNKTLALALLLIAFTPPAMVLIVSLQRPIWIPRILLWCAVPFFALACCGLAGLRGAAGTLVCAALAAVIATTGANGLLDGYYARQRKPRWEQALRYVAANQNSQSVVLSIGQREGRLIRYYTRRRTDPVPDFKYRATPHNRLGKDLRGYRKAWLLASSSKPNIRRVLRKMPQYGKRIEYRRYGGRLQLFVYRLKPPPPAPEPAPEPDPAPADAGDLPAAPAPAAVLR